MGSIVMEADFSLYNAFNVINSRRLLYTPWVFWIRRFSLVLTNRPYMSVEVVLLSD